MGDSAPDGLSSPGSRDLEINTNFDSPDDLATGVEDIEYLREQLQFASRSPTQPGVRSATESINETQLLQDICGLSPFSDANSTSEHFSRIAAQLFHLFEYSDPGSQQDGCPVTPNPGSKLSSHALQLLSELREFLAQCYLKDNGRSFWYFYSPCDHISLGGGKYEVRAKPFNLPPTLLLVMKKVVETDLVQLIAEEQQEIQLDKYDILLLSDWSEGSRRRRKRIHMKREALAVLHQLDKEYSLQIYGNPGTLKPSIDTMIDGNKPRQRYCSVASGELVELKTPISAIADTGASINAISQELANQLNLKPDTRDKKVITVASGAKVQTLGTVKLKWKFMGEGCSHDISFDILPQCVHDVVLGLKFLRLTRTLTRFKHRIKKVLSSVLPSSKISVNLLGVEQQRLQGYINGSSALVVPDSGANEKFISADFAKKQGLDIDIRSQYQQEVEFLDGSRAWTSGLVRNVQWQFRPGEEPVECDFFVLDELAVDVIMDNSFLDSFDVFETYEDCLWDPDSGKFCEDSFDEIFTIRMIGDGKVGIDPEPDPEEEYRRDMDSANPFSPMMVKRELRRRAQIDQRNGGLDGNERQAAEAREKERRLEWEALKDQYRQTQQANTSPATSTTTTMNLSTASVVPMLRATSPALVPRARLRDRLGSRVPWIMRRRAQDARGVNLEAYPRT